MTVEKQPLVSVNGVLGAMVSPLDRGFAYGDGVFETVRVHNGSMPLWPLHEQRLLAGADRLKIPVDISQVRSFRDQLLAKAGRSEIPQGVLKLILSAGEGGRGYARPQSVRPTLCLMFYPGSAPLGETESPGLTVTLCAQRLAHNSALAGIKHLNRLEQVLARQELGARTDREGLLLDPEGMVVEATSSNLFCISDGRLITPDLTRAGVAGVARRLIIDRLAPAMGMDATVMPLSVSVLKDAQEVFLCNSVRGIWPVTTLELNETVSLPRGPITQKLQTAFNRQMECEFD